MAPLAYFKHPAARRWRNLRRLYRQCGRRADHVILLPGDHEEANWKDQMEWAKRIGGDLPSRIEQAMLWANHRNQFKKDWYWSNETHHTESGWAWCQGFHHGCQDDLHDSYELRARAVRRLIIE